MSSEETPKNKIQNPEDAPYVANLRGDVETVGMTLEEAIERKKEFIRTFAPDEAEELRMLAKAVEYLKSQYKKP